MKRVVMLAVMLLVAGTAAGQDATNEILIRSVGLTATNGIDTGTVAIVWNHHGEIFKVQRSDIQKWAADGTLCKVLGHNWTNGRVGEGNGSYFADYHPGVYYRHCLLCKCGQSKSEGDWK